MGCRNTSLRTDLQRHIHSGTVGQVLTIIKRLLKTQTEIDFYHHARKTSVKV